MVETALFYVVFGVILLLGAAAAAWPAKVVAFHQRLGFGTGLWSGGYFYATAARARVTGGLVALVALVALISGPR